MSLWNKRALILTVFWVIVGSGYVRAGFSGNGPAELAEDTLRRNLVGAMVATIMYSGVFDRAQS